MTASHTIQITLPAIERVWAFNRLRHLFSVSPKVGVGHCSLVPIIAVEPSPTTTETINVVEDIRNRGLNALRTRIRKIHITEKLRTKSELHCLASKPHSRNAPKRSLAANNKQASECQGTVLSLAHGRRTQQPRELEPLESASQRRTTYIQSSAKYFDPV